jgi:Fur family peroxide stress response transcriptional regulator
MVSRRGKGGKPGGPEELLETFKGICSDAGLKLTHQRLVIFEAMAGSTDHPTVEEVFEKVKRAVPTIALDTVYRTLTTLEKYGALGRVQLETRTRFDPNTETHHHFVCKECNRIDDFYWPVFDQMRLPTRPVSFGQVDSRHVEIRGICKECQKKKSKSQ